MGSFETFIEIPVRVFYSKQKYEPATRHYPGQPAAIIVDAVEVATDNQINHPDTNTFIENYAFEHYLDTLTKEAEEDCEE